MAVVKTTSLSEDVSDVFVPGGEFRLQVLSAAPAADVPFLRITVEATVDATESWSPIYSWRLADGPIKRFAEQTRVRVRIQGNKVDNVVTVRRSE